MQQVKGAVLKSRIAFVEEHFGKDGGQQVTDFASIGTHQNPIVARLEVQARPDGQGYDTQLATTVGGSLVSAAPTMARGISRRARIELPTPSGPRALYGIRVLTDAAVGASATRGVLELGTGMRLGFELISATPGLRSPQISPHPGTGDDTTTRQGLPK